LILLHELDVRQERRKEKVEWTDIRQDLDALQEIKVSQDSRELLPPDSDQEGGDSGISCRGGRNSIQRPQGVAVPFVRPDARRLFIVPRLGRTDVTLYKISINKFKLLKISLTTS